jgi:hypothetical protein
MEKASPMAAAGAPWSFHEVEVRVIYVLATDYCTSDPRPRPTAVTVALSQCLDKWRFRTEHYHIPQREAWASQRKELPLHVLIRAPWAVVLHPR